MKVSVIIPTHNRAELLPKALQSVLSQSVTDWECLVVDDYSTDTTKQVVESFHARDGRIRYIAHVGQRNLQAVLNTGLHQAQGQYIARVDDDDWWDSSEKLQKQTSFLDSHRDHVLVGTNANFVSPDGVEEFSSHLPETDAALRRKALWQNYFLSSTVMFRRDAALELGGFPEDLSLAGDYWLWLGLGTLGKCANLADSLSVLGLSTVKTNERRLARVRDSIKTIKQYRTRYPWYRLSLFARYALLVYLIFIPHIVFMDRWLYRVKINYFSGRRR